MHPEYLQEWFDLLETLQNMDEEVPKKYVGSGEDFSFELLEETA